jgi:hypothetical protein
MGRLDDHVADPHGIQLASPCEAAFNDRLTQRISEQQQSLLQAKGAKQHAPVRVVFHFLF